MNVLLIDQVLPAGVHRRIEQRKLLQRPDAGTHDESQRRELDAGSIGFGLERLARLLELGDVSLVELCDVRQIDPARVQSRSGYALHAAQRFDFDRAELS